MVYCKFATNKRNNNNEKNEMKEVKWTSQMCNDEMQKLTQLKQWFGILSTTQKEGEKNRTEKSSQVLDLHCMQNILETVHTIVY